MVHAKRFVQLVCRYSRVAVALACAAASSLASPQAPPGPPRFPSKVELITVDAVVLDEHGQPVPGLTQDDFVVKEDGQPREIASFETFDVRSPRAETAPVASSVVATNEAASDAGRAFAIVVDDLEMARERTPSGRRR
jgi:Ca-activated chloride channel family protein